VFGYHGAYLRVDVSGRPGTGYDARLRDVLPLLKGRDVSKLWVHPTDQHPNERVHAVAGKLVAEALRHL